MEKMALPRMASAKLWTQMIIGQQSKFLESYTLEIGQPSRICRLDLSGQQLTQIDTAPFSHESLRTRNESIELLQYSCLTHMYQAKYALDWSRHEDLHALLQNTVPLEPSSCTSLVSGWTSNSWHCHVRNTSSKRYQHCWMKDMPLVSAWWPCLMLGTWLICFVIAPRCRYLQHACKSCMFPLWRPILPVVTPLRCQ